MAGPVARRRRRDAVLLLAGVMLVGLIGLLCAVLGQNGERVARMWVAADIRDDGTARITEVLDYDFDGEEKHGIFRTVPQESRDDTRDVSVTMDGAKVPFRVDQSRRSARIVIGDPAATVAGTHRYRIEYTLPLLGDEEWLAWDAVGTEWQVPIGQVEVHLAAPYAMRSVRCVAGSSGSDDACAAMEQPLPGQLDATQTGLDQGQGMTLYGHRDSGGGGGAQLPDPPTGPAPAEHGSSAWLGWLWVTGIALAATVVVAELLRLAGRERVQGTDGRIRRMDIGRLARSVQPSAKPPAGLGPAQGGILLTDQVRKHHLVGWLLGAGLDGYLRVTGVSQPVLRRSEKPPDGADELTTTVLGALFAKNSNVSLRKYNRQFARAWTTLRRGLRTWRSDGEGLWVRGGEQLRVATLVCGALAVVAGVLVVIVAAGDIAVPGANWGTPAAVGSALAGAGLAAMLRAWELRARTARGSELWCRVEAYRRHLAGLGQWDGRDEDVLTAWAVALGETKSWLAAAERAVDSTRSSSSRQAVPEYDHIRWQLALYMPIAAHGARSHTGSSSGDSTYSGGGYSGGGSSGGVGGGSGGGGGGSW